MRKIIESTLVSLDGVIGDPHLWATDYFDNEAERFALELLSTSDGMLMGRRTYEFFAAAFPHRTGDYGDRINRIRKFVFSSTWQKAAWNNSILVTGDVVADVANLKPPPGQDLVTYGHAHLGQTRLEHGLLDEIKIRIHPLFIGRGKLHFREGEK